MKYAILSLMMIGAVGCGKAPQGIDPDFNATIQTIQADFKKAGADVKIDISIQFGDATQGGQHPNAVGLCIKNIIAGNSIIIDQIAWNTYTPKFQEYILAHEIGHCILGREHTSETVQLTPFMPAVPVSIMNPDANQAANWGNQYNDYYFAELVGK